MARSLFQTRFQALGYAGLGTLILSIFLIDVAAGYDIAVAVFYVAVVFLATNFLSTRGVLILSGTCIVFALLGLTFSDRGDFTSGLFNFITRVSAIVISAYLVQRARAAREAVFQAEEQLARIAGAMRVGDLTVSIAHELNQPLAAVAASAGACRRWLTHEPPNLEKAGQAAERIMHDVSRASEVLQRMRDNIRAESPPRELVSINEIIRQSLELAQPVLEQNRIVVEVQLAKTLPPVFANRSQLSQVLSNLLLNSIEAMSSLPNGKRQLNLSSYQDDERMVVVVVSDSGVGIQIGDSSRLFEAFWTTKINGTGIGLTISRSIIESLDGRIWATSTPGAGAVFRIALPSVGD